MKFTSKHNKYTIRINLKHNKAKIEIHEAVINSYYFFSDKDSGSPYPRVITTFIRKQLIYQNKKHRNYIVYIIKKYFSFSVAIVTFAEESLTVNENNSLVVVPLNIIGIREIPVTVRWEM